MQKREKNICPHLDGKEEPSTKKKNKRLSLIVIGLALGIAIFGAIMAYGAKMSNLSEDEKRAVERCEWLISIMKDPDSFKLYEDIQIFECYERETGECMHSYMIIDYGGRNGYGGMVRSSALFDGDEYCGDLNEEGGEITDRTSAERYESRLGFELSYFLAELKGLGEDADPDSDTWYEIREVSMDKINKALKI